MKGNPAEFISMHERLNRIIERSLQLGGRDIDSPSLVDILYRTMAALDDGLTEGDDTQVRKRLASFSGKLDENELPKVVEKTIEKEAGSLGERRIEDWRQSLHKRSW